MSRTNKSKIRCIYDMDTYRNGKPPKITRYDDSDQIKEKLKTMGSKTVTGKCAGPLKSMHYAKIITCFVPINALYVGFRQEEKFKEWIDFINKLGFPCTFVGKSNVEHNHSKTYAVNIYPRDYPSKGKHLLACHTLIRYSYSYKYKKISKHTLKLFNKFGLNRWKCLYLAHYSQLHNSEYRGYYGLLPDDDIKNKSKEFVYPPDEVGVMQWLCDKNINKSFTNEVRKKLPKIDGKLQPLRESNYEDYIKHLKL